MKTITTKTEKAKGETLNSEIERGNRLCFWWVVCLWLVGAWALIVSESAFAARLSGSVYDAESESGIPNSWVFATTFVTLPSGEIQQVDIGPTKTDADGRYVLRGIPNGRFQVLAVAANYEVGRGLLNVEPEEGEERDVEEDEEGARGDEREKEEGEKNRETASSGEGGAGDALKEKQPRLPEIFEDEYEMNFPLQRLPAIVGVLRMGDELLKSTEVEFKVTSSHLSMTGKLKTDEQGRYRLLLGRCFRLRVGDEEVTNTPGQEMTSLSVPSAESGRAEKEDPNLYDLELCPARGITASIRGLRVPPRGELENVNLQFVPLLGSISGKVLNENQEPVPDVEVELRRVAVGGTVQQPLIATTSEEGEFEFAKLESGTYIVLIGAKPGIASTSTQLVQLKSGEQVKGIVLRVSMAKVSDVVQVAVYDEDGTTPLTNRTLRVSLRQVGPDARYSSSTTLQTGSSARHIVFLPGERGTYRGFFSTDGFCWVSLIDATKERIEPLKLSLRAPVQLVCRLFQSRKGNSHQPSDEGYVHLREPGEVMWECLGKPKGGVLKVAGLLPGRYLIAVTPGASQFYSEYEHAAVFPPVEVEIRKDAGGKGKGEEKEKEKEPVTVDLTLPPLGSFQGRVLGKDNTPLSYASLQLQRQTSKGESLSFYSHSDQQGNFRFAGVPLGSYTLTVSHRAYETLKTKITIREEQTPPLSPPSKGGDASEVITLKYIGLGSVHGKVLNPDGEPAVKVKVAVQRWEKRARYQVAGVVAKDDGSFEVTDLVPGTYSISAFSEDGNSASLDKVVVKGEERVGVGVLKFSQPARVVGRVKSPDGELVGRLEVIAGPLGLSDGLIPILARWDLPIEYAQGQRVAKVRKDGSFRMMLPPGTYDFILRGELITRPISKTMTVRAGEGAALEFVLPKGGRVEGSVIRIDKQAPVPMAVISIHDENGQPVRKTVTTRNGTYRISGLMPGRYTVRCQAPELALGLRHDVLVEEDSISLVDFNLAQGASVVGRLAWRGANQRWSFSMFRVMANADVFLMSSVAPDGSFRLEYLPPGRHLITVYRGGEQTAAKEVVLKEGEEREVVVEIP